MQTAQQLRGQAVFYSLIMALCAAMFINTLGQQAPAREPLGSFAVPRCVTALIMLLCATLIGQTLQRLRKMRPERAPTPAPACSSRPRTDLMVKSCLLMTAYAAFLTWPALPSVVTTPLFLFAFILILAGRTPRATALAAGIALFFGLGLHVLFKTYLYVNLP